MKKTGIILLIVLFSLLTFSLVACNGDEVVEVEQDTSPITISAPLNSRQYFLDLEKCIEEDLGIEVDIEWEDCLEHTQYTLQKMENGCSSDIVFSPTKPSDEVMKNNFVNLDGTDFAANFTAKTIRRYSVDKAVYMLPTASTIYGITYNKTLFNEKGWTVPTNLEELENLKTACDNAGCNFSTCLLSSTGDGFNYLIKFASSGYLSTFEGEEWLDSFLTDDSTSVDSFTSSVEYLYKLKDAGLFDNYIDSGSLAWDSTYANQNRYALFVANIAGNMTYTNAESGITDEYGLMPFFDEEGNKSFVYSDNSLFGINKSLEADNKKLKLENAKKILNYMVTSEKAINLSLTTPTSYLSTRSFEIDESRMYYDYKDLIENSYVIASYANDFDTSIINEVSPLINTMLKTAKGEEADKSTILTALKNAQHKVLTNTVSVVGKMGETLSVKETAEVQCKAAAISLQEKMTALNIEKEITVSMIPYADSLVIKDLSDSRFAIRFRMQKDDITELLIGTTYSSPIRKIVAVELTGKEIKEIQSSGYDSDLTSDTNTINPWLVVTKNNITLNDDDTYVVAVPQKLVSALSSTATQIADENGTTALIEMKDAMASLFKSMDAVYLKDIDF